MVFLPAVTTKHIQRLDRVAVTKIGIPSLVLMENAGQAVAREIIRRFARRKPARAHIICGVGHNGGDGFVTARYLMHHGVPVKVFLLGKTAQLKNDTLINCRILKRLGGMVIEMNRIRDLKKAMQSCSVIVDAIFGVGLNRNIGEPLKGIIENLNKSKRQIVSIDIPSGLDATSGKIYGVAVKAEVTVTLTLPKKGFYLNEGPRHTGQIVVVDIGIPQKLYKAF